jgi:hypothetical protein
MSLTPEETEFEDRRKHTMWERFEALEQECRRGHRDLRKSVNELEAQADSFDKDLKALTVHVEDVAAAPVESTKIRFSTGVMVSIVAVTISLVGAAYGISNRVLNRIDTFEARMDRQATDDKAERASAAKTAEERYLRSEKQFDAFGRQMELMKYEQQRLREDVTKTKGSTR